MKTACLLLFLSVIAQAGVPPQPAGPAGRYDVTTWKQEWVGSTWEDGVTEGRVDVIERGDEKRWRVTYAVGQIGPAAGGAAWNQSFAPAEEITFNYIVRFSPNFDWAKGGKLPGIGGGSNTTGGRPADGFNGFSVRPMWRTAGKAEAYVYHAGQKGSYGDSFRLPEEFHLPSDEDITVTLRVKLNHPERADGQLELTFATKDSRQKVRRDDLVWRRTGELKATSLLFETFHGGNDLSWAPRRACSTEFGKLRLTSP
jgi:hypothetical protein